MSQDSQRAISGANDGRVKYCDRENYREIVTFEGHSKEVAAQTVVLVCLETMRED